MVNHDAESPASPKLEATRGVAVVVGHAECVLSDGDSGTALPYRWHHLEGRLILSSLDAKSTVVGLDLRTRLTANGQVED